jgi:hypothetical protein
VPLPATDPVRGVGAAPRVATDPGRAASIVLLVWLLLVFAIRVVAARIPTMHAWSANDARFLPPWLGIAGLAAMALALIPGVRDRLATLLDGGRNPTRAGVAIAGVLGVVALIVFPDRLGFVGDFLLRAGSLHDPGAFSTMFPQAMPLDPWLHYELPRRMAAWLSVQPAEVARAIGVSEGVLFALVAARFVRGLELRGAPATAVYATALFGGAFTLYTGYGKPTIDLALLTACIGVFGLELIRTGRSGFVVGVAATAAIAVHRSSLSLLPALVWLWSVWFVRHGRASLRRSFPAYAGLALFLVALALLVPRYLDVVFGFDVATNLQSAEVRAQGGVWSAAFHGSHLLDLANIVFLLAPFVVAAPALVVAMRRRIERPSEPLFLAVLVFSFVPSLLFVHVTQGPFRDWDAFAGAGVAMSLLSAWFVGTVTGAGPHGRRLAPAVVMAMVVPMLLRLLLQHDVDRGLAQVRALLTEPPARTESQQIATWDFIGLRNMRLGRWQDAADAYRQVAQRAPHPRALQLWGTNAAAAGQFVEARMAFRAMTVRAPERPMGWAGLWAVATFLDDTASVRTAEARLRSYPETGAEAEEIGEHLGRSPELARLFEQARGAWANPDLSGLAEGARTGGALVRDGRPVVPPPFGRQGGGRAHTRRLRLQWLERPDVGTGAAFEGV